VKITAYLRVSTDAQAEHGLGLDVQRQAIRAWARAHGHRITSWHTDSGVSGSNGLDFREALPDAVAEVRAGRAAGLVVYRLDRLARDLVLQETLLAEIAAAGGLVFSTMPGEQAVIEDDPEDPSRRLIRQVLGAVAEYERSLIRLRLRNGRRRKAEQGGYAFGSPPYGYRAEGRELVPEPAEQVALARIRQLRAVGSSIRQIAVTLTAEGHRPKRGERWHPEIVRRILARDPARRPVVRRAS
jgi:DNA invertase Pin-like site-specific DNA recombinase